MGGSVPPAPARLRAHAQSLSSAGRNHRGQSLPGDAMAQRQLHRLVQSPPPARGPLVPGSFQVSHRRAADVGQAVLGSRDFIEELTKRVRGTRAGPFARALAEEAESYLSNVQ